MSYKLVNCRQQLHAVLQAASPDSDIHPAEEKCPESALEAPAACMLARASPAVPSKDHSTEKLPQHEGSAICVKVSTPGLHIAVCISLLQHTQPAIDMLGLVCVPLGMALLLGTVSAAKIEVASCCSVNISQLLSIATFPLHPGVV